ncbi:MAG TPA: preprotein translocase subunit YajC [Magnetospirillaceae bacterium]|jgi:preprotein translocase subunit YajC
MLISEAWAQSAGGAAGGMGGLEQFLPLVLIFVVFYFFMIRPQQQKAKKHKELIKNLRRGDRVLSNGGIFGTVAKVINDAEVQVEISEGVRVRMLRSSVSEVLAKTEPLSKEKKDSDTASDDSSDSASIDAANDAEAAAPAAPRAPQGIAGLLSKFLGGK